jgi:geranylgeranyl transferase type-2 subunit alpha
VRLSACPRAFMLRRARLCAFARDAQRSEHAVSEDALVANAKLLTVNPDQYTVWNHRREMLLAVQGSGNDEAWKRCVAAELELTATALRKNPKSYCAWFQRRWIVDKAACSLATELELCRKFLELDERNCEPARLLTRRARGFEACGLLVRAVHCWSYRMWVAGVLGVDPARELEFTTEKIHQNFSNYSAWHYRSKLLPRVAPLTVDVLAAEFELVRQARRAID